MANTFFMDHQFVSSQMQGRHEELLQQEKRDESVSQMLPKLRKFQNGAHSPATVLSRAKPANKARKTRKRKDCTLKGLARDNFQKNKLGYLSGKSKGQIDRFVRKMCTEDTNSIKADFSNLYSKEEWMSVLHHIKSEFPNLGASGKRNLRWITKEAHRIDDNRDSLWSQSSQRPEAALTNEDLKWLYDCDESFKYGDDVDPEVSFEESMFVSTLSQDVLEERGEEVRDVDNSGEKTHIKGVHDGFTVEQSPLIPNTIESLSVTQGPEIVSDSEPEIEVLQHPSEQRTPKLTPESLERSSTPKKPTQESLAFTEPKKLESFTDSKPLSPLESSEPIKPSTPLVFSTEPRDLPTPHKSISPHYKQGDCVSARPTTVESNTPESEQCTPNDENRPTQGSVLIHTPVSSHQPPQESAGFCSFSFPDHVLEVSDSFDMKANIEQLIGKPAPMSSPFVSKTPNGSPFKTPRFSSSRPWEKSLVNKGHTSLGPGSVSSSKSVRSEVVFSDDDFATARSHLDSQSQHRPGAKKRRVLRTTRYRFQSNLRFCDREDTRIGVSVRHVSSEPVVIDSEEEVPDSEDEGCNVSILEITREVNEQSDSEGNGRPWDRDSEVSVEGYGHGQDANTSMVQEDANTSVVQVPSSPQGITGYLLANSDFDDEVVESPVKKGRWAYRIR